jgi:hypothetical protein
MKIFGSLMLTLGALGLVVAGWEALGPPLSTVDLAAAAVLMVIFGHIILEEVR